MPDILEFRFRSVALKQVTKYGKLKYPTRRLEVEVELIRDFETDGSSIGIMAMASLAHHSKWFPTIPWPGNTWNWQRDGGYCRQR